MLAVSLAVQKVMGDGNYLQLEWTVRLLYSNNKNKINCNNHGIYFMFEFCTLLVIIGSTTFPLLDIF